jgi:hypothetical protein
MSAIREIAGVATMKGALKVRSETILAPSLGGTLILMGMMGYVLIKQLAIGRCNILHIRKILQTAFYLK